MKREMRRSERMLSDDIMMNIMNNELYGVLSTVDNEGIPYGVPLNFVYEDSIIYFHCAKNGHKLDNISSNANASFCVVTDTENVADKFTTKYKSVIAFGKIQEVAENKKIDALMLLIKKCSPDFMEKGQAYVEKGAHMTKVFALHVEHMSAKGH